MATIKELSDGGPDGTRLGQTVTDKIGFYGATPAARPSTAVVQPASTASVSISATQWGLSTSTQFDALIDAVYAMAGNMVATGLSSST